VQTALKLDDKQKEKFKNIEDENQKAMRELFQGGGGGRGNANREKMQELRKKAEEDINAVLTDDQKKAFKDLLGDEFKGEIGMGRRRGGNGD
jgi:Spy/CpxP family protein refolding chaperone